MSDMFTYDDQFLDTINVKLFYEVDMELNLVEVFHHGKYCETYTMPYGGEIIV